HAVNAIRREKSVINALSQAVLVDWISEIAICVAIVLAQRRCCHAELCGGTKVFENLTPITFVASTAAMTFIDDDEIEKVRRVFLVQTGAAFIFRERLINREINLAALNRIAVLDLCACIAELSEDF